MICYVKDLSTSDLQRSLRQSGLSLVVGPFVISIATPIKAVARHLAVLYAEYAFADPEAFVDFYIGLQASGGLRRWIKPTVTFSFDGLIPFTPLPQQQAPAQLEWGLNWCIAAHAHQYAIIHSAVVEKGGLGLILPGAPGSGKSTLCAGLIARGWRLLSDEMALISVDDLRIQPIPRPISLKNASIDIIRRFYPEACFGELIPNTTKGDMSFVRPPSDALQRCSETVHDYCIVFPTFAANETTRLRTKSPAEACMALIENCFNFHLLRETGFEVITRVSDTSRSYELIFATLDDAIRELDTVVAR